LGAETNVSTPVVALIVKADDVGLVLAKRGGPVSKPLGLALVQGMPPFLSFLGALGTAAMLWVGGGIVLHGLEEYHLGAPAHWIHDAAHAFGAWATGLVGPGPAAALEWLAGATGAGLFGLALGIMIIPLVSKLVMPLLRKVKPIE
jgi:predicted DNA repair protein MutK